MAAPAAPRRVDIDRDGDLTLVVGPERRKFLVCSRTLCRASPVFRQMLNGNDQWKESRPKNPSLPWVVNLPDDNYDATKIILGIIHSRFSHVPSACETVEDLYEILVVADKYDMTKLLRPWAQGWVTSLPPLEDHDAMWPALGVATELGAKDAVRRFYWRIATGTKCDNQGNILFSLASGKTIKLETAGVALTPFKLIDHASQARTEVMVHILEVVQELITNLQNPRPGFFCVEGQEDNPGRCESTLLGLCVSSLAPLQGLSPRVWLRKGEVHARNTWSTSGQEIAYTFASIRDTAFMTKPHNCNTAACLKAYIKAMTGFRLVERGSEIPPDTLAYMEKQRGKLGDLTFPTPSPPGFRPW